LIAGRGHGHRRRRLDRGSSEAELRRRFTGEGHALETGHVDGLYPDGCALTDLSIGGLALPAPREAKADPDQADEHPPMTVLRTTRHARPQPRRAASGSKAVHVCPHLSTRNRTACFLTGG